jgi:hypothetical protein
MSPRVGGVVVVVVVVVVTATWPQKIYYLNIEPTMIQN